MDAFNFVFSLFGLLLGFSLAEVLGGFARALRHRHIVRIGWLTPLLGIFVMLDLISFWETAWGTRAYVQPKYGVLMLVLAVAATYYLAASLVVPAQVSQKQDFDAHYFDHHRQVLGAVAFCHIAGSIWLFYLIGGLSARVIVELGLYYALLIVALITRSKVANLAALVGLIGIYVVTAVSGLA